MRFVKITDDKDGAYFINPALVRFIIPWSNGRCRVVFAADDFIECASHRGAQLAEQLSGLSVEHEDFAEPPRADDKSGEK